MGVRHIKKRSPGIIREAMVAERDDAVKDGERVLDVNAEATGVCRRNESIPWADQASVIQGDSNTSRGDIENVIAEHKPCGHYYSVPGETLSQESGEDTLRATIINATEVDTLTKGTSEDQIQPIPEPVLKNLWTKTGSVGANRQCKSRNMYLTPGSITFIKGSRFSRGLDERRK